MLLSRLDNVILVWSLLVWKAIAHSQLITCEVKIISLQQPGFALPFEMQSLLGQGLSWPHRWDSHWSSLTGRYQNTSLSLLELLENGRKESGCGEEVLFTWFPTCMREQAAIFCAWLLFITLLYLWHPQKILKNVFSLDFSFWRIPRMISRLISIQYFVMGNATLLVNNLV